QSGCYTRRRVFGAGCNSSPAVCLIRQASPRALAVCKVSRSGAMPEPTVTVRMKEDADSNAGSSNRVRVQASSFALKRSPLHREERFMSVELQLSNPVGAPNRLHYEQRVETALEAMRAGRPVILVDDDDRENEADLIVAAEKISVATMALLIRECSGIVCL